MREFQLTILMLLSLTATGSLVAEEIVLTDAEPSLSLTTGGRYFVDSTGDLNLADIMRLPAPAWNRTDDEYLNLGTNANVGWLRARVRNQSGFAAPLLVWEYPWGDRAQIFVTDGRGPVASAIIGIDVPIKRRAYQHRIPVLQLELPPGSERGIYIRIESTGTKVARFYVEDQSRFLRRDQRHGFIFFLFLGALAIMLALNLILAFATRSTGPLYYALVLLFYGMVVALFRDYLTEAIFPSNPEWKYRSTFIIPPLMGIALVIFWKWLLLLRVHAPRIDRALWLVVCALGAVVVMALLPEPDFLFLNSFGKSVFYVEGPLLVAGAALAVRKGFYPAFYSLSGLIFFQGSIAVYLLATSDALPMNVWTEHVLYLGLAPEFAFFMLSVFSRTRLLKAFHPEGSQASEEQRVAAYIDHIDEKDAKYKKSKIVNIDSAAIIEDLERLMKDEKLFCDEDLSLSRLAEMLSISTFQLSEIINANYQKNFFRFLNEYRIAEAKTLLRSQPGRPIAAVARSVGFHSLSSFNGEFKRITGTTPSRFRRETTK